MSPYNATIIAAIGLSAFCAGLSEAEAIKSCHAAALVRLNVDDDAGEPRLEKYNIEAVRYLVEVTLHDLAGKKLVQTRLTPSTFDANFGIGGQLNSQDVDFAPSITVADRRPLYGGPSQGVVMVAALLQNRLGSELEDLDPAGLLADRAWSCAFRSEGPTGIQEIMTVDAEIQKAAAEFAIACRLPINDEIKLKMRDGDFLSIEVSSAGPSPFCNTFTHAECPSETQSYWRANILYPHPGIVGQGVRSAHSDVVELYVNSECKPLSALN